MIELGGDMIGLGGDKSIELGGDKSIELGRPQNLPSMWENMGLKWGPGWCWGRGNPSDIASSMLLLLLLLLLIC